jgi:uncharacterized protein (TIGR00266 family)
MRLIVRVDHDPATIRADAVEAMRISLAGQPSYTLAYCYLEHGEAISCESGAMVALSAGIRAQAALEGGVVRSALRRTLGGESLIMARYTASVHGAWVALAPRYPGDITAVEVQPGSELLVQSAALLAHSEGVVVDVRFSGPQAVLLREGVSVLKVSGSGTVLFSAYGALQSFPLQTGEAVVVDTGHLVAWSPTCTTRIGPLSGVVSSTLTGEGLVAEMTGPGRVWIQSRAEQGIRDWLFPDRQHDTGA